MDTITQVTLGAAVGEAIHGKQAGNRAPLWGAVFGVVPDLDVLASPFLSQVQELAVHRGITHSILFCLVAPLLFGWLLSKLERNSDVEWQSWSWLVFGVLITHVFIDLCTSYGTQIFQPFSNYSASLNSIFIIDPFYTLPLMIGILTALFLKRSPQKRRLANYLGLGLSSLYLLAGFGIKAHVNAVFEENFQEEHIAVDRYMTSPAPFTVFLWTAYAEADDRIYAGMYSIFDKDRDVPLTEIPRNTELIEPYKNDLPVERVIWFSRGYYTVQQSPEGLIFSDLRFGRSDLWLSSAEASYVWNYRLQFNADSTTITGFDQFEPSFDARSNVWEALLNRIFGNEQGLPD